jgi:methylmalonyl-CoA mutase
LIRSIAKKREGVLGSDLAETQIQSQDDFNTLIKGIEDEQFELIFDTGLASPAFLAMVQYSAFNPERALFCYDPFSFVARHGRLPLPEKKIRSFIRQITEESSSKIFCANTNFWHHSGATIVQELGITLAVLSEYLASVEPDQRRKTARLSFVRMAAGPLYFPEIAKFRAIRLLWSQLLEAYEIESNRPLTILAETTGLNKTVTDPNNNMLRSVTEAMAAITGGADYLAVQPFNSLLEEPDEFSKRISRNVQHILREEAHFDKTADPAAGSYYIESLTDTIGRKAWNFFRQIEKEGGIITALKNGLIQNEIGKSKEDKETAYHTGNRVLVGTNKYPNTGESLPASPGTPVFTTSMKETAFNFNPGKNKEMSALKQAFRKDALLGDLLSSILDPQKVLYRTVEEYRAGQIFDEIRLRTENYCRKTGLRPKVQLVPVGDRKWRNVRVSYAQNTLGCGGFEINRPSGFETIEESVDGLKNQEADLFVLCSSDREYDELIAPFCQAFKSRGLLILAGNPGEKEDIWRKSGIDHFIGKGMNLPHVLIAVQNKLFRETEES